MMILMMIKSTLKRVMNVTVDHLNNDLGVNGNLITMLERKMAL